MITEQTIIGKIEILEDGQLQVRTDTVILRDGVEIARTFHREVLEPGQDIADRDAKSLAVSAAVWTPEVVRIFKEKKAAAAWVPRLTDPKNTDPPVVASSVPDAL